MLVLSPVEVFKIQTEEEKWEMENGEGKGSRGAGAQVKLDFARGTVSVDKAVTS